MNYGNISADILDLTVELEADSRKFGYKLYDKRDKFKFSIVNYPDLGGNIAKACGYGVAKSELKRYSRLSSKFSDFLNRKKLLFDKVLSKGYVLDRLNQIYNSVKVDSKF